MTAAVAELAPSGVAAPTAPVPVISIVLPARNEAAGIARAIEAVDGLLLEMGLPYEIIVGDSGSTDGTGRAAAQHPHVRVVREELPGKGRILTAALAAARGSVVGFIDSDLEISVDYLRPAIRMVFAGADAAIGSKALDPALAAHRSTFRRTTTAIANRLIRFSLGTSLSDHQAGMKVFRREPLLHALRRVRATGWLWDTELLALMHAAGGVIQEIPVLTLPTRPSRLGSTQQFVSAALELGAVCSRVRLRRWFSPSFSRPQSAGAIHAVR